MTRPHFFGGWILLACLCLIAPSFVDAKDVNYRVEFRGSPTKRVREKLELTSNLVSLIDHPPSSLTALRQRADADVETIISVLHSYGYYNAEVSFDFDQDTRGRQVVIVDIVPGKVFRLTEFRIFSILERPGFDPSSHLGFLPSPDFDYSGIDLEELGIIIGFEGRAKSVLEARSALLDKLETAGYPFAEIAEESFIADRVEHTLAVTVYVNAGPQASFGALKIEGLESVAEEAIRKKISWQEGERYDPEKVRETRRDIQQSGLFSAVQISYPDAVDEEGQLLVLISLVERPHRTIELGLSYDSYQLLGALAGWEHRNWRGKGEKLSVTVDASFKEQEATVAYLIPDFLSPKQDLQWDVGASHIDAPTFNGFKYGTRLRLRRQVSRNLDVSLGVGVEQKQDSDTLRNLEGTFVTLPGTVFYRTVDRLLDPQSGVILRYEITPNLRMPDISRSYVKQILSGSSYYAAVSDGLLTFAGKLTLGSIVGARLDQIQATDLFHAGSDRLLRGYRYLTLSPLDSEGKPRGGRSIWVASLEARSRPFGDWGFVAFFDVGRVDDNTLPSFTEEVFSSTGFGLRYHTAFGPLRADIAFPLNRRRSIDRTWEYYISFGQAF